MYPNEFHDIQSDSSIEKIDNHEKIFKNHYFFHHPLIRNYYRRCKIFFHQYTQYGYFNQIGNFQTHAMTSFFYTSNNVKIIMEK